MSILIDQNCLNKKNHLSISSSPPQEVWEQLIDQAHIKQQSDTTQKKIRA